jgi:hypothetical protein
MESYAFFIPKVKGFFLSPAPSESGGRMGSAGEGESFFPKAIGLMSRLKARPVNNFRQTREFAEKGIKPDRQAFVSGSRKRRKE